MGPSGGMGGMGGGGYGHQQQGYGGYPQQGYGGYPQQGYGGGGMMGGGMMGMPQRRQGGMGAGTFALSLSLNRYQIECLIFDRWCRSSRCRRVSHIVQSNRQNLSLI